MALKITPSLLGSVGASIPVIEAFTTFLAVRRSGFCTLDVDTLLALQAEPGLLGPGFFLLAFPGEIKPLRAEIIKRSPLLTLLYAEHLEDRCPSDDTRQAVLALPNLAGLYAQDIDKGPRDDTRAVVCDITHPDFDPYWAYTYALFVDRCPRDDTRKAACQEPATAVLYAEQVDKCPRPDTWAATNEPWPDDPDLDEGVRGQVDQIAISDYLEDVPGAREFVAGLSSEGEDTELKELIRIATWEIYGACLELPKSEMRFLGRDPNLAGILDFVDTEAVVTNCLLGRDQPASLKMDVLQGVGELFESVFDLESWLETLDDIDPAIVPVLDEIVEVLSNEYLSFLRRLGGDSAEALGVSRGQLKTLDDVLNLNHIEGDLEERVVDKGLTVESIDIKSLKDRVFASIRSQLDFAEWASNLVVAGVDQ